MKRNGLAVGAIACVAILALTGCDPRVDGDVQEFTLVDSQPAGTKAVDEVTWAIVEGEPATLNPAGSASLIIPNLCDNLLSIQPDFSIMPGIA